MDLRRNSLLYSLPIVMFVSRDFYWNSSQYLALSVFI